MLRALYFIARPYYSLLQWNEFIKSSANTLIESKSLVSEIIMYAYNKKPPNPNDGYHIIIMFACIIMSACVCSQLMGRRPEYSPT